MPGRAKEKRWDKGGRSGERRSEWYSCSGHGRGRTDGRTNEGEVVKGANNRGWTNKPMDPKPSRDSDCLKIKSASNYHRVRPLEPRWTHSDDRDDDKQEDLSPERFPDGRDLPDPPHKLTIAFNARYCDLSGIEIDFTNNSSLNA